jgi:hypothetical protein
LCLICHVFHFSRHSSGSMVYISLFFRVSRHIPDPTVCISHFSHFLRVSRNIPGPTVCISHFVRFSVFLAIFQVIQ